MKLFSASKAPFAVTVRGPWLRYVWLLPCLLGVAEARATVTYWNNTAGGSFNVFSNWTGGSVPGPNDVANFSSNNTYQVTWSGNATNLAANVTGGAVTYALGSSTWRITSAFVVGQGTTGSVNHISGTIVVTNSQGTAAIVSGQNANRNYTLSGGTAVTDFFNFQDDGSAAWSRLMSYGNLTTLHGSVASVGADLVFWYLGGQSGTWNMLGGTNTIATGTGLSLYTQLGWAYDSQYTINVNGPTTLWKNIMNLVVGNTGTGHKINISGGATAYTADTWIGRSGSGDVVTVDGTNSLLTIQTLGIGGLTGLGQLFLSENARDCRLVITNGGRVSCGLVTITRYTSGTGNSVLVTGGGSLWSLNNSNLVVGDYGTSNRVTIANGGRIDCGIAYTGGSGSTTASGAARYNSIVVTDTNSLLNASSSVRSGGFAGNCLVLVSNGGTIQASSALIGNQSQATNCYAIVTGPGSVWNNTGTFTVGSFGGTNFATISNGGQVFNTRGAIGNASAGNLVLVTGADSLWSNATDIFVGNAVNAPGNQLVISNNGTVVVSNLVVSVTSSAFNNSVTLAGGILFATNINQLGTLDVRRGALNLLSGFVETDRLFLTNTLSRINFSGGRLNAANATVNNGLAFNVGSGTNWARYHLKGGTHSFGNGLNVVSNGWLTGSGTVTANVTNNGVLAPDTASGYLTINGNLQLQPNSDLAFDLGGYTPGFDDDYLSVSGNVVWNGRLHIRLAPGFTPNPWDTFTVAQCAGDTGSFINVTNGGTLKVVDNSGSFVVSYGNGFLELSNYQPLDPGVSNNFKAVVARSTRTGVTIQFPFNPARTYRLWFSTDLANWIELPVPGYAQPKIGLGEWTDDGSVVGSPPFSTGTARFYRISVE